MSNLLKYKNGDRLLTPRLYTEDKFCCRFHQWSFNKDTYLWFCSLLSLTNVTFALCSLTVDYFPQLPVYHCRSLCFTSHESTADFSGDSQVLLSSAVALWPFTLTVVYFQVDWMVDLYPKGVWFQRCFKICTSGSMKEVAINCFFLASNPLISGTWKSAKNS